MSPNIQRVIAEGRAAYLRGESYLSNPYNVSRHSLPTERLAELAWSYGWLLAEAAQRPEPPD